MTAIPAARGAQCAPLVDPFSSVVSISVYTYVCARIPGLRASVYNTCVHSAAKCARASAHSYARTAPANAYWRVYHHRVLYNAAIDSRPLFHARDLLQSLQPVFGDSLQCPVSLPVSVHKIYFPRLYTGWRLWKPDAAKNLTANSCADYNCATGESNDCRAL